MVVKCIPFKLLAENDTVTRVQHQHKAIQRMIHNYLILNTLRRQFYCKIQYKSIVVYHKCESVRVQMGKFNGQKNIAFCLFM